MLEKVIGISISVLILAMIFPIALEQLANATLEGVDPTVITVVQVLVPVLAAIGMALYFIPKLNQ